MRFKQGVLWEYERDGGLGGANLKEEYIEAIWKATTSQLN